MEESYRKDLSHLTWDEVFARQVRPATLVEDWMNDLSPADTRALHAGRSAAPMGISAHCPDFPIMSHACAMTGPP